MSALRTRATLLGCLAIVLWATNSAATVKLVGKLGPLTALMLVNGLAGLVLAVLGDLRQRRVGACLRVGWRFGLIGGACFVGYQFLFFLAFAWAPPGLTLPLNLVNYLWPSLTVVLALLVARAAYRVRPGLLVLGLLIGLGGVVVTLVGNAAAPGLSAAFLSCPGAFVAMFAAAIGWAVFSVVVVPLRAPTAASGTPLFFLATALVAACARPWSGEAFAWTTDLWSMELGPVILFAALVPTAGGYLLWELAAQHGELPLLGALSNALPVLSSAVLWCMVGNGTGGARIAAGALLVCGGAYLVHRSVRRVAAGEGIPAS